MTALTLPEKVVAIHQGLADLPHAFGGALALAYYAEPRTTVDIDVNVFVAVERLDDVFTPLAGLGVDTAGASENTVRDGQVRVFWAETAVDLFFAQDPFHDAAARAVTTVPFAGTTIPILAATHLVVCKAVFDRSKDWVDIEAILEHGTPVDGAEVLRWVARLVGDTDPRYDRVGAMLLRP